MFLLILAYLGGVLTILSPCILPVLPFVFARADRPFASNGLPMLAGMALTFAAVATLAALGGGWAVDAAALSGASLKTTFLLLTYAAGAATSLALALLIGGRVFAAMKRSLGAGELVRRTLGVLVLAGVAAIALGLDTHLLARLSLASTGGIEQKLIDAVHLVGSVQAAARATGALPVEGELPSLAGATRWLNSAPLTTQSLRGTVVLVDFWTYSCINCMRALPYVRGRPTNTRITASW